MFKEWVSRPDLNWCPYCWFNARIESCATEIGTMYLCHGCGTSFRGNDYPGYNTNSAFELNEQLPRHFSDEEWSKYWEENIKIKEQ